MSTQALDLYKCTIWEGCLQNRVRTLVTDAELVYETVLCFNDYTFTTSKHKTDLVHGAYRVFHDFRA